MCRHRLIEVKTERDACSWVRCKGCGKSGPKKHSYLLAVLAWAMHLTNMHPRKAATKRAARNV